MSTPSLETYNPTEDASNEEMVYRFWFLRTKDTRCGVVGAMPG
jgi:hypothetical protein